MFQSVPCTLVYFNVHMIEMWLCVCVCMYVRMCTCLCMCLWACFCACACMCVCGSLNPKLVNPRRSVKQSHCFMPNAIAELPVGMCAD